MALHPTEAGPGATPRGDALPEIAAAIDALPLVDHHVHSVFEREIADDVFTSTLTESHLAQRPGASRFDSQLGFAIRRWCAPVLGLEPFASPTDYLRQRAELGFAEVSRRFMRTAGISDLLIDGGFAPTALASNSLLAELSGARVHDIVRLESVAEAVVRAGTSSARFIDDLDQALGATGHAVGYKTVIAYRHGLSFDASRPAATEVRSAAAGWLAEYAASRRARLTDPVIMRHLIWWALETGKPLQFHTGFGDQDVRLVSSNPALLQSFIADTAHLGTPITLLHCYPYQREAAFLAHLYPHVFFDVGAAVHFSGSRSVSVVAEALEIAPFSQILFSTDAWGLPDNLYAGTVLWRRALATVLSDFASHDGWPVEETVRVARMIARDNALAVYGLGAN